MPSFVTSHYSLPYSTHRALNLLQDVSYPGQAHTTAGSLDYHNDSQEQQDPLHHFSGQVLYHQSRPPYSLGLGEENRLWMSVHMVA